MSVEFSFGDPPQHKDNITPIVHAVISFINKLASLFPTKMSEIRKIEQDTYDMSPPGPR